LSEGAQVAKVAVGKKVPAFSAPATGGTVASKELVGKPFVLYFYPRDDTPGCTLEGEAFRDHYAKFRKLGVRVLGVSRDGLTAHEKFKAKFAFPFELIADTDAKLCGLFDVIRDKNMYGKKVRGIERSTFLYDADGTLRNEWRKVTVKGHVNDVLRAAMALEET
jgi:peroxiredoxin Q/BCP